MLYQSFFINITTKIQGIIDIVNRNIMNKLEFICKQKNKQFSKNNLVINENLTEILKMKNDIEHNFDNIVNKVEDSNFKRILSYFKEKVESFNEFEKSFSSSIFQKPNLNGKSLLRLFSSFYNNMFSSLPILGLEKLDSNTVDNSPLLQKIIFDEANFSHSSKTDSLSKNIKKFSFPETQKMTLDSKMEKSSSFL